MDVRHALVSLWRHPTNLEETQFVCSGVFVDDCRILTVGHALGSGVALWVRAAVNATQSYRVLDPQRHDGGLDAALLRIEAMPSGSKSLRPCARGLEGTRGLELHGFFEGREHSKTPIDIKAFVSGELSYYELHPKQEPGLSGAPIVAGDEVVGLTFGHYVDANTHLGCAIGIHQLQSWLASQKIGVRLGDPSAGKIVGGSLSRSNVASARSMETTALRKAAASLFRLAAIRDSGLWDLTDDGVPRDLDKALATPERADLGRAAVESVLSIGSVLVSAVRSEELKLSTGQQRQARSALFRAMGHACKLCLDEQKLEDCFGTDVLVRLDVSLSFGAMLVVRDRPASAWQLRKDENQIEVSDRYARSIGPEIGDGEAAVAQLERMAFASLSPDGVAPVEPLTDKQRRIQRGDLNNLRLDGKGLCFYGSAGLPQSEAVKQWAAENHVQLVSLTAEEEQGLFLYPESLLHGRVKKFITLFPDDWPGE